MTSFAITQFLKFFLTYLPTVHSNLDSISITPDEVELCAASRSANHPNLTPSIIVFFVKLPEKFHRLYRLFFNTSLRVGKVPDSSKEAHVTPVPKGGDLSIVSNLRPISLLSNIDKSFEHLHNQFLENNILTPFQSGFTPGDSTVNQLTYLYNTLCQAEWHADLIHKLRAAGISGCLLEGFKTYLTNRKLRDVLPGGKSKWNFIYAGVNQESILGSLPFLLYINDIVTDIRASICLFADDTSLFIINETPELAAQILNKDPGRIDR